MTRYHYIAFMLDAQLNHFTADVIACDEAHAYAEIEAMWLEGQQCLGVLRGKPYQGEQAAWPSQVRYDR